MFRIPTTTNETSSDCPILVAAIQIADTYAPISKYCTEMLNT